MPEAHHNACTHRVFVLILVHFPLLGLLAFQLHIHGFIDQVPQYGHSFGALDKRVLQQEKLKMIYVALVPKY